MNIPPNLGSLEDLKRRSTKAMSLNGRWEDLLDDTYEFFLPNRNLFDREDSGQKKMDRIFDSTAQESIQQGASKMQAMIAPIWSDWAIIEPSQQTMRLIEENDSIISEKDLRENLEKQFDITFDYIHRSNFSTQFFEMILDILIGTGSIMINEEDDDDMPISFHSIPQIGIGFEEGPNGGIETHWRKVSEKARNVERKWDGFEVSKKLREIIKDKPDDDIKLMEGVIYEPVDKRYYGIVWVEGEQKISWFEDYQDSSPWVTGRYSKTSGEIRGRGPAIQALPDVKSLNKVKEFVLQKAALDLSGMWTAVSDGTFNPHTVEVYPGVVIPVSANGSQNPSLQRLDTSSDLNLTQFEVQELQNSIKKALFADAREPSDSVVSATQFAYEARELAERIGSAFGRLQTEVLVPILKRVYWILKRRGLVTPVDIGGRDVEIKFTSPLAKTQDSEDLLAVQQAVEFTMATAGEEAVHMAFKKEDFGTWAARKTGMPQELVRSDAEKAKIIEAGAQVAQQQMEGGQNDVERPRAEVQ